jgi:hypothetical protein
MEEGKPLEAASGSVREEKKAKAKPKPLSPSRFEGCGFCYFWLLVGCGSLSVATLSIMVPWCYGWVASYRTKRTVIDGKRFVFDGHGGEFIGRWILYVFLFLVTVGVFGFWIPKKLRDWRLSHTHSAPEENPAPIPFGEVSIVGENPKP